MPAPCSSGPNGSRPPIAAFDAVIAELGDGDRLSHAAMATRSGVSGFADDYANMARAALQLWEVTGETASWTPAKGWVAKPGRAFLEQRSWAAIATTANDAEPLFVRARMLFDNPAPSANGTMLTVLTRLALITGDTQYISRASTLAVTFGNEANRVVNGSGTYSSPASNIWPTA